MPADTPLSWPESYTDNTITLPGNDYRDEAKVVPIVRGIPVIQLPVDHPAVGVYVHLCEIFGSAQIQPIVVTPGGDVTCHGEGDAMCANAFMEKGGKVRQDGLGMREIVKALFATYGCTPLLQEFFDALMSLSPEDGLRHFGDDFRQSDVSNLQVRLLSLLEKLSKVELSDELENALCSIVNELKTPDSTENPIITDILYLIQYAAKMRPPSLDRVRAMQTRSRAACIRLMGPLGAPEGQRMISVDAVAMSVYRSLIRAGSLKLKDGVLILTEQAIQTTPAQWKSFLQTQKFQEDDFGVTIELSLQHLIEVHAQAHLEPPCARDADLPMVDLSPEKPIQYIHASPGSGKTTLLCTIRSILAMLRSGQGAPVGAGSQVSFSGVIIDAIAHHTKVLDPKMPGISEGHVALSNFQRIAAAIARFLSDEAKGSVLLMDDTSAAPPDILFALFRTLEKYVREDLRDRFAIIAQHVNPALTVRMSDEEFADIMRAYKVLAKMSGEVAAGVQQQTNLAINWESRHQMQAITTLRAFGVPDAFLAMLETALAS